MRKLTSKEKIRRMSGIASAVLMLYLILPFVTYAAAAVSGFIEGFSDALSGTEANAASDTVPDGFLAGTLYLILAALFVTVMIIAVVSCLQLLMSIRKDESPFTERNGRKIRTIGIAFMLLEPVQIALTLVQSGEFSVGSGIMFSAGIVMYCISLVFRYGCELQQESDETL